MRDARPAARDDRSDPYVQLAPLYDKMAHDPGIQAMYREWRDNLLKVARDRGVHGRVLVDLACGTGNSTLPWRRQRGWTLIGVDRSAAMLRVARKKSKAVRWIRQDLRELDLGLQADFVTCHFDALNHLLDEQELACAFERVARLLRPGGLFQFDLNTEHWLRWLNGRDKLFRLGPHCFTATNVFDEKSGVAIMGQLWFVKKGRHYQRHDVAVQERAFSEAFIKRSLRRAGLRLLQVDAQFELEGRTMRWLYVAEKPKAARGGRGDVV